MANGRSYSAPRKRKKPSIEDEMEGMMSQGRKKIKDTFPDSKPRKLTTKEKEDRAWARKERKRIENMTNENIQKKINKAKVTRRKRTRY
jgi:hypothetical protein